MKKPSSEEGKEAINITIPRRWLIAYLLQQQLARPTI